MRNALSTLGKRPLLSAMAFSAMPYVGLRIYLSNVMHADRLVAMVPSATFLFGLLSVGALLPAFFLVVLLRRLIAEKDAFELRGLLEIYFGLVLVFAVTYAVLQASGLDPAFSGMPTVWNSTSAASAATHLQRLHAVFGDALYLSVVTMTTVGFGDLVPLTFMAKGLTALQGLVGIGFLGLVLGQYFSSCVACSPRRNGEDADEREKADREDGRRH